MNFIKIIFGSMLGFFLSIIVLMFVLATLIGSLKSFGEKEKIVVNSNSVLTLYLDHKIPDRTPNKPEDIFNFNSMFKIEPGLFDIIRMIKTAKDDINIKGIYLHLSDIPTSYATISEIRMALKQFKESGKFIYAYGDTFSQKAYYLATVADRIFINPLGSIDLKGVYVQIAFYKGLLEKLEVEAQVVRHGEYKSAVEPFIMDKMSAANRKQTKKFTQTIWDNVAMDIADDRGLSVEQVNTAADNLMLQDPKEAKDLGFVDDLITYDVFLERLSEELGVNRVEKHNFVEERSYYTSIRNIGKWSSDRIAIVYASGNIVKGENAVEGAISDGEFSQIIRGLRLDEKIKGVVLRVNSPGGDALSSDIILHELELLKEVKPVVVSMGGVAASGGYYIACKADYIYAEPSTITGSIGVFGIIPNIQKMLNNKLGVTFDEVKSNSNSDYISLNKPMQTFQRRKLKAQIEKIYSTFIQHVSIGRHMSVPSVDSIGQGRVWAGRDALAIGLIDAFGGIDEAIKKVVDLGQLSVYRLVEFPKQKEMFQQILDDLSGRNMFSLGKGFQETQETLQYLGDMIECRTIQARIPYSLIIK
jgi:protease-4